MGLCEGNWTSEIKLDKKEGDVASPQYKADGVLHICPSTDTDIRGQQTVKLVNGGSKTFPIKKATCVPSVEKDRFEIKYRRESPEGETYQYEGSGRVLNNGNGPGFIHGRVTITPEEGEEGGGTGVWEAIRVGGHGGRPGPGEGPDAPPSEETVPGIVAK